MELTRARCYCNAIQSRVTTRLVVWLHNPICQAIGHRRAAVRVIPAGCCRFLARLAAAVRVGSPGSRNSADFQGRDSASDLKDDPDMAPVGYARDYGDL